jgi:hypothetical protein
MDNDNSGYRVKCKNPLCPMFDYQTFLATKAEAISAFRLATRADVKSGIDWISVKDRLPEDDCNNQLLVCTAKSIHFGNWIGRCGREFAVSGMTICEAKDRITHWAEINLPDKE